MKEIERQSEIEIKFSYEYYNLWKLKSEEGIYIHIQTFKIDGQKKEGEEKEKKTFQHDYPH